MGENGGGEGLRHAYLIIAHGDWEELKLLLGALDHPDNDIYVHIDKKAGDVPEDGIAASVKRSRLEILREYAIYWGSFEMVEAELALLKAARSRGGYGYYHLLSGADLPTRTQEEIHAFFEEHAGREFVHFATDAAREKNHEIARRTRVNHWMMHWNRRFRSHAVNRLLRWVDRGLIAAQLALGVDRMRRFPGVQVRYGSSWFSITEALADCVLGREDWIRRLFHRANSADELFLQTVVHATPFREKLYHPAYDGLPTANQRYVDWTGSRYGSPRTLTDGDWEAVLESGCLFARKFSMEKAPGIAMRMAARARGDDSAV